MKVSGATITSLIDGKIHVFFQVHPGVRAPDGAICCWHLGGKAEQVPAGNGQTRQETPRETILRETVEELYLSSATRGLLEAVQKLSSVERQKIVGADFLKGAPIEEVLEASRRIMEIVDNSLLPALRDPSQDEDNLVWHRPGKTDGDMSYFPVRLEPEDYKAFVGAVELLSRLGLYSEYAGVLSCSVQDLPPVQRKGRDDLCLLNSTQPESVILAVDRLFSDVPKVQAEARAALCLLIADAEEGGPDPTPSVTVPQPNGNKGNGRSHLKKWRP